MSTFTDLTLVGNSFNNNEGAIYQFWCDASYWCDTSFWCQKGGMIFTDDRSTTITFTDLRLV